MKPIQLGATTIVVLCLVLFSSCENENVPSANCDDEVLINNSEFGSAPDGLLTINELEIIDGCLKIVFGASGCGGETWEVKLIDSGDVMESNPPQRRLRLSLLNQEVCLAFITRELTFDIESLQVDGDQVLLNIINSNDQILYEY